MKNKILLINSVLLAMSPMICVYKFVQGLTYDYLFYIFLLLLCTFGGLIHPKRANASNLFIVVFICGFLSFFTNTGSVWYSDSLYWHNLVPISISFFAIMFLLPLIKVDIFKKTLIVCGIVTSLICIIQILSVITFGFFVPAMFFPPGLEVTRALHTISMTRPCSLFTEPAHFCIFISPIAYLMLIDGKKVLGFFFIVSMICSTSTTGLLLAGLIIFAYLHRCRKLSNMFLFGVLAIIAGIIVYAAFPTVIQGSVDKLTNTDADSDVRLLGPLSYMHLLSITDIIYGIGINQLETFVLKGGGKLATEGSGNYANATLYVFFSYGIIGFIALFSYILKLWKRSKDKGFLLIFLAILCSDQILFSSRFIYLMTFAYFADEFVKINKTYVQQNNSYTGGLDSGLSTNDGADS